MAEKTTILQFYLILLIQSYVINPIHSQDTLFHAIHENDIEVGITVGTMLLIGDLELSTTLSKRVSQSTILEAKAVAGLVVQLYLFEGNKSRYLISYGGGTVGINFGKINKFFELTLGTAYFNSPTRALGTNSNQFLPIGTIGYKYIKAKSTFRVGFGIPHGLYISFNF